MAASAELAVGGRRAGRTSLVGRSVRLGPTSGPALGDALPDAKSWRVPHVEAGR